MASKCCGMQTGLPLLLLHLLLSASSLDASNTDAASSSSGSLRGASSGGSGGDSAASAVGSTVAGGENVMAQWGIWWGSCRNYGCSKPYVIGQLCGCWPGCSRLGLCCSDYYEVCYEPTPAPTTPAPTPAPLPSGPSDAPLYTFYMYRAQSNASYPPKNVNTANLAGVMWYLQHEVATESPPKFGVTRILRYKVQAKAPARLLAAGMDFGVRYAYDSQKCTGPGDCSTMYAKYGYFVGCNTFASKYPYPNMESHYAGGVWYSLPGQGACAGSPTGAADCTYGYSWPPDELTLDELAAGDSATFWANPEDSEANKRKVQRAADLFQQKYPDTALLTEPQCNFKFGKFWH